MSIRRAQKSSIAVAGKKGSSVVAGYGPGIDEMDLIQRVTVGAGGSGAVTFSSIPQIYQHLHVRITARSAEAGTSFTNLGVRVNGDSTANYTRHLLYGNGTSAIGAGSGGETSSNYFYIAGNAATTSVFGVAIFDVLDYAVSTKVRVIRGFSGWDSNGSGFIALGSGALMSSTAAVTSLTFLPAGSTYQQYSVLSLYGVKA